MARSGKRGRELLLKRARYIKFVRALGPNDAFEAIKKITRTATPTFFFFFYVFGTTHSGGNNCANLANGGATKACLLSPRMRHQLAYPAHVTHFDVWFSAARSTLARRARGPKDWPTMLSYFLLHATKTSVVPLRRAMMVS